MRDKKKPFNIPDIKKPLNAAINMYNIEHDTDINQKDFHIIMGDEYKSYNATLINNVASGRVNNKALRYAMEKLIDAYYPERFASLFIHYNPIL